MNHTFTDEGFKNAVARQIASAMRLDVYHRKYERAKDHMLRLSYLLSQYPEFVDKQMHYYDGYILSLEMDELEQKLEQLEDDSDNENDNK